ncbi:MAG TPA: arylesterase [Burkholderiales bacterium]|nr:arylesterase [Burkholderiales bacterium]
MLAVNRFAIALVFAAALVGCGKKVPPLAPVGPNDVIVAFGDSLTYGTGASESESYPAVLAQIINRQVIRSGVPGETTRGGLARLESVIEEHRPVLMIVSLGGNDMLGRVGDAEIKANLRSIIQTIRGRGISVVLFGVPKPALITSAAPFYEELAQEFDIPYEGKIVTDVLYRRDQKSDPIHPNAIGYRRMAEAFAELLKKAGAI